MKKAIITLSLISILATSCISTKSIKLPTETVFNKQSASGLVVGTISFNYHRKKAPFDNYLFQLSYDSNDKELVKLNSTNISLNVNFFNGRFNGELNDKKTFPFAIELNEGTYNFDGFKFWWNGGYVTSELRNPVKFSLPIEVQKGVIHYIGNITINLRQVDKSFIEITDEMAKYEPFFKAKYSSIDWNLLNNKTIKTGDDGFGFIKLNK